MPKNVFIVVLVVILAAGAAVYSFAFKDAKDGEDEPAVLCNYAIKDSFVTNVKNSSKLLKTTVVLVVNKEDLEELLNTNQYIIRDTILFILRNLTEEDIKSSDTRDKLRVSIPQAINTTLKIENVVSVYFSDFVMQ